jgi:hypothetical protein
MGVEGNANGARAGGLPLAGRLWPKGPAKQSPPPSAPRCPTWSPTSRDSKKASKSGRVTWSRAASPLTFQNRPRAKRRASRSTRSSCFSPMRLYFLMSAVKVRIAIPARRRSQSAGRTLAAATWARGSARREGAERVGGAAGGGAGGRHKAAAALTPATQSGPVRASATLAAPSPHLLPVHPQVDLLQHLRLQQRVLGHRSAAAAAAARARPCAAAARTPAAACGRLRLKRRRSAGGGGGRGAAGPRPRRVLAGAVRAAVPAHVDLDQQPCGRGRRRALAVRLLRPVLGRCLGAAAGAAAWGLKGAPLRLRRLWRVPGAAARRGRGAAGAPRPVGGKQVHRARLEAARGSRRGLRRLQPLWVWVAGRPPRRECAFAHSNPLPQQAQASGQGTHAARAPRFRQHTHPASRWRPGTGS